MLGPTKVPALQLTPRRSSRKTRPSWSPQKSKPMVPDKPEPTRAQTPVFRNAATIPTLEPIHGIKTAALNFDFSYWDEESREYVQLNEQNENTLKDYLADAYSATYIIESGPFLIIQCDVIPAPEERPFLVADCVAIWLHQDDPLPNDLGFYGEFSMGKPVALPANLAPFLRPFSIPSDETLDAIANLLFPEALYVSYITCCVIFELPETDRETFLTRLETLPSGFSNTSVSLNYVNGPLVLSAHRRIIKPNPRFLNGQSDETDYIDEAGCFSPGAMISSKTGGQVTTGISLTRNDVVRFTVAYHAWESEAMNEAGKSEAKLASGGSELRNDTGSFELETEAGRFGAETKAEDFAAKDEPQNSEANSFMPVFQGKHKVGNVVSRVGLSDIGLAKADSGIIFSNTFLDIEAKPRRLLASKEIKYRDRFLVDSFVTGAQSLFCLGVRKPTKRNTAFKTFIASDFSRPYISFRQGIFATNAAEIAGSPKIRDGICGSALVRLSTGTNPDVLDKGEIGGFMVWSNIRDSNDDQGRLICFCEATDELIAEGWEVAELNATKRKFRESEEYEREERLDPIPKAAKTFI